MTEPLELLRNERVEKLGKLEKLGVDTFPPSYNPKRISIVEATKKPLDSAVVVAGRILGVRGHGKIVFADLSDSSGKVQLCFKKDKLTDKDWEVVLLIDRGDIIGIAGNLFNTDAGELTILCDSFSILSKSLRPLPSEWYGLKDMEVRYRQRYLDLILNPEVRTRFEIRSKLVKAMRDFLGAEGYIEVETPTLQPLYGGANAKPFTTHLNALDCDLFLRVADELYLKRLVIGGYERVFEICKDFRNEGMDLSHNPEFTMIEYYEAYADYQRMMDLTEEMFRKICMSVHGKLEMTIGEKTIDLSKKWQRIELVKAIEDHLGINVLNESKESLVKFMEKNKIEGVNPSVPKGQLIFDIFEHLVTDKLIGPVWIIDYPKEVSPLSKSHRSKEGFVERFEGYIGGKEICDGWSELTNPLEQRERFEGEKTAGEMGKEDAQQVDEDFLEAMEYGMPPLGGIGIGIDRLTMFFTNTWSIKEVILFPTMRPKDGITENRKEKSITETSKESNDRKTTISKEEAVKFLNENLTNKNMVKHCIASGALMAGVHDFLKKRGDQLIGTKIDWEIAGILHDADAEKTSEDAQGATVGEWLKDRLSFPITHAMAAHNEKTGTTLESAMDYALFAGEKLTGLIVASALIFPSKKLSDVSTETVLRRFREKSFAKGARRENIQMCEKLGMTLEEFCQVGLESMKKVSSELGL
ncbi:lysine--tRNA ligase [candidate division WWE3 bacterium CG_4_10_14_0_2_um_filter_42_7]|uniref:Lysine--tRNA ligase n=2 Tax=Katanobacteria TaxID=422282 RepID=A0A2H0X8Y4_UNCKA|nr:MAG: lysine--tRNA ligase [candidate division WWE3 bacterium CG08_land_8_20_14_0_20_41_15]PIZ43703.1 MAG: lysine--tRNA ligase [candidate division WWE3 bacterium CG_4_10_14_0_2_um_filter_42_7]